MTPARRHVVLFVKEPIAGRVKTRLGRDVGMTAAAWWFRHQARALARRLAADPRWTLRLAIAPDGAARTSRFWPRGVARLPQGGGDLGRRMARVFASLPPGPAVILGADIPDAGRTQVAAAFDALRGHDAVMGPARDGGYWLIGLRAGAARPPHRLFDGVRWSTRHALSDTEATLKGPLGVFRVARLETLSDVDVAADFAALRGQRPSKCS